MREAAARITIVIIGKGMDPKRLSWDVHKGKKMAWLKEEKCCAEEERGVGIGYLALVSKSERYLERIPSNSDC
jgi:hypothetical protein